jgi:hypothetical protein
LLPRHEVNTFYHELLSPETVFASGSKAMQPNDLR